MGSGQTAMGAKKKKQKIKRKTEKRTRKWPRCEYKCTPGQGAGEEGTFPFMFNISPVRDDTEER